MGAPLTMAHARDMLRADFDACDTGCWGIEVEWVIYRRDDQTARPSLRQLAGFAGMVLPAGGRITLEPGGQLELSTAPRRTLDGALDALALDTTVLEAMLEDQGLIAVDTPVDLQRLPLRILDLPRYRAMEAFLDAGGPGGRWMMCNTASVQVNVSHDPEDPEARWHLLNRLAPVLVAAFANSPGLDSSGRPWASLRQAIWGTLDPGRTRQPRGDQPAAEAWADYALTADVMLVRDNEDADPCRPGTSFAKWMDVDLHGRRPGPDDLRYHVTTLFPPVRPRGWLEVRVLDALPGPAREVAALVIAACLEPEATRALAAELPDLDDGIAVAARHGLQDAGLAAAADLVFEIATANVAAVTDRPERRHAVVDYVERHVRARLQPWGGSVGQHQPNTLVNLSRPEDAEVSLA